MKLFPKIILFAFVSLFAAFMTQAYTENQTRGVTADFGQNQPISNEVDLARIIQVPIDGLHQPAEVSVQKHLPLGLDNWVHLDTITTTVRIPPGDRYVLALNPEAGTVEEILPAHELSEFVMSSVERAPQWLRADLVQNFNAFRGDAAEFFREMLAEMILEAEDPVVDEIAFCIAHISPDLLGSGLLYFDLITENAASIYAVDEHLDYVRIVDHGGVDDDNYWSSVEYKAKNAEGDTIQYEIDPYYYYWYIVHPRLSDERPLYINPATGRSQAPPNGVFWRDFLFNHPDEGYPSLREALVDCGVLWSNLRNNGTLENGAIGAISTWIHTILDFDSGNERPIQPVRIYRLHMGRCGEHEDMTAAAARTALIPAAGIAAITNDHVWNEFYDGRWIQWEPVNNYIDDSLAYERWQGGNWRCPALFRWRGDGFIETVTSRYQSNTCQLVARVSDANGHPVDGVRLYLRSESLHGGLTIATCAFTGSDGMAAITLSESPNIWVQVDSEIGHVGSVQVIENSEADQVYEWECELDGEIEYMQVEDAVPPDDPVNHFNIGIAYEPLMETVRGRIFQYSTFFAEIYPAKFDFFICDEDNYNLYLNGEVFSAFNYSTLTEQGEVEFALPTDDEWFAVFSNDHRVTSLEDVALTVLWSRDSEWSVPDLVTDPTLPDEYSLQQNYPNPFNAATVIPFTVKARGDVRLAIHDMQGREMAMYEAGQLDAGFHAMNFDASDLNSGVYFYSLECNGFTTAKKMIVMK